MQSAEVGLAENTEKCSLSSFHKKSCRKLKFAQLNIVLISLFKMQLQCSGMAYFLITSVVVFLNSVSRMEMSLCCLILCTGAQSGQMSGEGKAGPPGAGPRGGFPLGARGRGRFPGPPGPGGDRFPGPVGPGGPPPHFPG